MNVMKNITIEAQTPTWVNYSTVWLGRYTSQIISQKPGPQMTMTVNKENIARTHVIKCKIYKQADIEHRWDREKYGQDKCDSQLTFQFVSERQHHYKHINSLKHEKRRNTSLKHIKHRT